MAEGLAEIGIPRAHAEALAGAVAQTPDTQCRICDKPGHLDSRIARLHLEQFVDNAHGGGEVLVEVAEKYPVIMPASWLSTRRARPFRKNKSIENILFQRID
jgi:hypothetical protein